MQFIPILEQEGPKVEAIKNDTSLTGRAEIEGCQCPDHLRVRSIILYQYTKLQAIARRKEKRAVKKKMNQ